MNKKAKIILNLLLIIIAGTIVIYFYASFNVDGHYAELEQEVLTNFQEQLSDTFDTAQNEDELKTKLKALNEQYASEIILTKNDAIVFSTFPSIDINNIRDVFDSRSTLFKSQGDIVFKAQNYRMMYIIYHINAEAFVTNEMNKMMQFIIVIFALFFILSILVSHLLYSPLYKINKAILEMEKFDFNKAMQITGNDAVTYEFSNFIKQMDEKFSKDSRKYTQLELVLLFEKQRLALVLQMARGALHELKTPIYQQLLRVEDRQQEIIRAEQSKQLQTLLLRINELQQELKDNVEVVAEQQTYFDVILLYREIEKDFYYLLETKNIAIDFVADEYIFVKMNKLVIHLILHNLLSNITKYSVKDTEILFEIYTENGVLHIYTENETTLSNLAKLNNEDTGDSHELDDPYSSGVGIKLVEEIIEHLGGTIVASVSDAKFIVAIQFPIME